MRAGRSPAGRRVPLLRAGGGRGRGARRGFSPENRPPRTLCASGVRFLRGRAGLAMLRCGVGAAERWPGLGAGRRPRLNRHTAAAPSPPGKSGKPGTECIPNHSPAGVGVCSPWRAISLDPLMQPRETAAGEVEQKQRFTEGGSGGGQLYRLGTGKSRSFPQPGRALRAAPRSGGTPPPPRRAGSSSGAEAGSALPPPSVGRRLPRRAVPCRVALPRRARLSFPCCPPTAPRGPAPTSPHRELQLPASPNRPLTPLRRGGRPGGGLRVTGSRGAGSGAALRSAPGAAGRRGGAGGGPGRGRHRRGWLRPRWRRRAASPPLASPGRSPPRRGGAASPHSPARRPRSVSGKGAGSPTLPLGAAAEARVRCRVSWRPAPEEAPAGRGASCRGCGWHHGHRAGGGCGRAPCALRLSPEMCRRPVEIFWK